MKKILLILFISCMSQLAFSQASGLYIVREVYTTGNYPNDTLIVTSPIGTTVGYSLNPNRDQVLSQVLNSIIALGYRVIPMGDFNMDFDYGNTSAFRRERVMFLAAPWTTASSELEPLNNNLTLYPNPTTRLLTIDWDIKNLFQPTEVVIINSTGYIVLRKQIESIAKQTIDVSSLASGTYMICVKDNCRYSTLNKFVKQ